MHFAAQNPRFLERDTLFQREGEVDINFPLLRIPDGEDHMDMDLELDGLRPGAGSTDGAGNLLARDEKIEDGGNRDDKPPGTESEKRPSESARKRRKVHFVP